jgi:hypothetical protein
MADMPTQNTVVSGNDEKQSELDDLELLNQEDDKDESKSGDEEDKEETSTEEKKDDKTSDEEDDKEDKKDKKDEDDEEDDDDEEELDQDEDSILHRPTFSEIKTKYPTFFKDFPDMRHMMGREREFTNLFGTVPEAKEAVELLKDYGQLDELVTTGNVKDFLSVVKNNDEKVYDSFVGNFLDDLKKQDSDRYIELTMPINEIALRTAYNSGKNSGNKNLMYAAEHLSQFLFGTPAVAHGEKTTIKERTKVEDKKESTIDKERQEFQQEKGRTLYREFDSEAVRILKSEIIDGLDPNNRMSDYLKNRLVDDIITTLDGNLKHDEDHNRLMDSVFKKAEEDGFSISYRDRLVRAYLKRARELMPKIRKSIRMKALGGKVDIKKKKEKKSGPITSGGASPSSSASKHTDAKKVDWRNTSDLDILNAD